MKYRLSEQECLDVSSIMALMAEQKDIPDECSAVMKRGASLLKQAVQFCTVFCQSYSIQAIWIHLCGTLQMQI